MSTLYCITCPSLVFCSKNDFQNILSNRHLSVWLLEYNMFILTYFVFFLVSLGYVLSECIYVRVAKVLDCSDQRLTKIPYVPTAASRHKYIIHVLNLRRNNIKSVSEHELTIFPAGLPPRPHVVRPGYAEHDQEQMVQHDIQVKQL